MSGHLVALGLLLLGVQTVNVVADDHDCIVGSPPRCNHSLADDKSCRGLSSSNITAWQSMECDYVIYDVKAKAPSNKYIVIHAGGCDTWTEDIGDWAYRATGFNLFGLRPCLGLNAQTCTLNRGVCDALHVSWTMPSQPPQAGLGFNPPALIRYAKEPSSKLLFIHEYDGRPSYPWAGACNLTEPAYVCVYSSDQENTFHRKFYGTKGSRGIQGLLEQLGNSKYFPFAVKVIDARNSSSTPGMNVGPTWGKIYATNRSPKLPCSGMFPSFIQQGWAWELQGCVTSGMKLAMLKQQQANGSLDTGVLGLFKQAMDIALGD